MNGIADFRSDTVTRPCPDMRRAMAEAEVGDDVLGDDPTVLRLQEVVAELFGAEAALFVPSGTMGNQIAVYVLTTPGEEILFEERSHLFVYEAAAPAVISGVQTRPLPGIDAMVPVERLEAALRPDDDHQPRTRLVVVENTHNLSGGRIVPLSYLREVRALADRRDLRVHLDGARLFNAHVASGVALSDYAAAVDLLSTCLSKGLGCPVGSLLVGSRQRIDEARRVRKMLGGGMRQVGILAAAGLFALEHLVERLAEDHARAARLAAAMADLDGFEIDPALVQTNIVIARRPRRDAAEFAARLAEEGVWGTAMSADTFRLVTHRDVNDEDVERALVAMQRITG